VSLLAAGQPGLMEVWVLHSNTLELPACGDVVKQSVCSIVLSAQGLINVEAMQ